MKVFGLNASQDFALRLAERLGVPLAEHEEREFEDGECKLRPLERVRGERVLVCQSLYGESGLSPHDKLCRLLFFVGALKEAGAIEVTAITPYLAYARKDRRTQPRDPVTSRYLALLLEASGVDMVVTMDVHNLAAYENAFRCRKENLQAAPLLAEHFRPLVQSADRVAVLSPDAGGIKRAKSFARVLNARFERPVELAFMEKERSLGRVSGEAFAGDVEGAAVIIVDDLISGGTTMARSAKACMARGAREVHAAATHGVLARVAGETLASALLSSVVIMDTVGGVRERCPELGEKLHVLDSTAVFAEALSRLTGPAVP
jgi:ribose-phosphate pyrophosphokinase